MTATTDFDRLVATWLDTAGPADIRPEAVDSAIATARSKPMRRGLRAGLVGPTPWPSGRRIGFWSLPPAIRIAVATALLAGLIGGGVYVGSRLLEPVTPPVTVDPVNAIQIYEGRITRLSGGVGIDSPIALSDGNVLGFNDNGFAVWDVSSGVSIGQGPLNARRSQPTSVLLGDGRVLVLGSDLSERDNQGSSSITTATAEVWDPRTMTSTQPVPLTYSRWIFGAIRLADGRVLVSGGVTTDRFEDSVAESEIFDPATGAFSPTGPMTMARVGHTMTLLVDGRVLVAGGNAGPSPGAPSSTTEIYDPVTGTFSPAGPLPEIAANPDDTKYPLKWRSPVVTLAGGQVLVPGLLCQEVHALRRDGLSDGVRQTPIEIFDPSSSTFVSGGSMPHCVQEAFPLPNGELYIRGWWYREDWDEQPWAGLYDPSTGKVREVDAPSANGQPYNQTTVLPDGRIVFFGTFIEVMN